MIFKEDVKKVLARYKVGDKLTVTMNWPHRQNLDKRYKDYNTPVVATEEVVVEVVTDDCLTVKTLQGIRTVVTGVDILNGAAKVVKRK